MKSKNYICHASCLMNNAAYDHDFWYTCVKWQYISRRFLHFLKILILRIVRREGGIKGQKMFQNDKKLSCSISQEPYIIGLSFMVPMSKMIISQRHFFHVFKVLIFQVDSGVKGQKITKNILSVTLHISGTIHHMIAIYGTHV